MNFLNKKLEIISERLTRDLMIRPTQTYLHDLQVPSLSAPLFHLPAEKLQYCNIIAYFNLLILFLVYYRRDVTWEKKRKINRTFTEFIHFSTSFDQSTESYVM